MFSMNKILWDVVTESVQKPGTTSSIMQDRPDITHQTGGGDRLAPCSNYAVKDICGYYRY